VPIRLTVIEQIRVFAGGSSKILKPGKFGLTKASYAAMLGVPPYPTSSAKLETSFRPVAFERM
jgi:hypothetical protein